jgi:hypothetical protein
VFGLFIAIGNGLHKLLEQQSRKFSFLRVMALDVEVALEERNPWLLADDGRSAYQSFDRDASWLGCVVLLATLEFNVSLLSSDALLGRRQTR